MSNKPIPYIGITGIQSTQEAAGISNFLHQTQLARNLKNLPFTIMLGVTSSNKRLRDPESSGKTSPKLNSLIPLFEAMPAFNTLPMLHYFTDRPAHLAEEVKQLLLKELPSEASTESLYPMTCKAIQINQEWPDSNQIQKLKNDFLDLVIVIQLPASALQEDDSIIVEKAKQYENIDYLLIDPSGGTGKDLDLTRGVDLFNELDYALPATRIGIAGGFGADNVSERIEKFYSKVGTPFCIDAQGKLRTDDLLDTDKALNYLNNAYRAFKRLH